MQLQQAGSTASGIETQWQLDWQAGSPQEAKQFQEAKENELAKRACMDAGGHEKACKQRGKQARWIDD